VTESTGTREAAINVADGERQAAILKAEGDKQSNILRAEGEKEAQKRKAEGYAVALKEINASAAKLDNRTVTLQYFDALKNIGVNPATKYIFPMEFTGLLTDFLKGRK
jgi:regulator of protease activity HflC (stomatin/prohibitin superfamily)